MHHKLQKANPQHCTAKKLELHRRRYLIKSFQSTTNRRKRIILSISINSCRKNRGLCNSTVQLLQAYVHHVETELLYCAKHLLVLIFVFCSKLLAFHQFSFLSFSSAKLQAKYMNHVKSYRTYPGNKLPEMHGSV